MRLLFLILAINYSYSQNSNFDEANMLYNEGRYIDAIDVYNKILDSGLHSSDLYFNIGNSYYKINEYHIKYNCTLREAAYLVALEKLDKTYKSRGI